MICAHLHLSGLIFSSSVLPLIQSSHFGISSFLKQRSIYLSQDLCTAVSSVLNILLPDSLITSPFTSFKSNSNNTFPVKTSLSSVPKSQHPHTPTIYITYTASFSFMLSSYHYHIFSCLLPSFSIRSISSMTVAFFIYSAQYSVLRD